ncbi:hypothetical protein [Rhodoflexus sp.]
METIILTAFLFAIVAVVAIVAFVAFRQPRQQPDPPPDQPKAAVGLKVSHRKKDAV